MSHPSSRRRLLGIAAAAVAMLLIPVAAQSAAAASSSPIAKYVALGDSYAAGQGAGPYEDSCLRSAQGYPALLDATAQINLLRDPACSATTIAQVAAAQVNQVNHGTSLVTVTAGANDLGIAQVYAACAADAASIGCQQAVATAQQAIPAVGRSMAALLATIRTRAPQATIVVTGYPRPFADSFAQLVPLAAVIDQATDALDAQLAGAVQVQPGAGTSVRFAAVSFGEHAIGGSAEPWVGGDVADPVTLLHPTAAGYVAYRDAILAARS